MAKPTSCVLSERPKVECARDECSHEAPGYGCQFPKDENRKRKSVRASVSSCLDGGK